jgi:hypothetical protein
LYQPLLSNIDRLNFEKEAGELALKEPTIKSDRAMRFSI